MASACRPPTPRRWPPRCKARRRGQYPDPHLGLRPAADKDKGLRAAYIGTHNYEIGVNLAKLAQKIKPKGGTICIQSGGAAAANHNERMQGIRDTLAGKKSAESPGVTASPARTGGRKSRVVRSIPTTTSRSPSSRWRTSSTKYPDTRRLHPDRRLPAVPAGRLREAGREAIRTRSPRARSRSSSPTRCLFRSI